MNAHQFYNLLENRIELFVMKNSFAHQYPENFIQRYNAKRDEVITLSEYTKKALEEMTKLEKEQLKYTKPNVKE